MRPKTSFTLSATIAATSLIFTLLPATSTFAAGSAVLNLQLNEKAGATVARDTSGLNHNGTIGSHITMNGAYADWDRHSPGEGIAYGLKHLITIPDAADGSLDPGSGNFSVTLRFRTKDSFGNVLQKGQATTAGGQVKFQIPGGKLSCMFKTASGTATAASGTKLLERQPMARGPLRSHPDLGDDVLSMASAPAGATTRPARSTTPSPGPSAASPSATARRVSCDYFAGEIDYVTMTKG